MDFFNAFKETTRFSAMFAAACVVAGCMGGLFLARLEYKVVRFDRGVFKALRTAGLAALAAVIALVFAVSVLGVRFGGEASSAWVFMICTFLASHFSIAAYAVGCYGLSGEEKLKKSNFMPHVILGYFALFSAMMLLDAGFWFEPPLRNYVKSVCLFVFIPLSAALIRATALRIAARNPDDLSRASRALSLLFALMLLGDAANHLHDFIWCGYVTGWYSEGIGANPGSHDLAPFARLVQLAGGSYRAGMDYAVFGAYATLLMFLEVIGASALLFVGALWNREDKIWPVPGRSGK